MSNPTAFLRAASATRRSLRASVLRSFPRFPPTRALQVRETIRAEYRAEPYAGLEPWRAAILLWPASAASLSSGAQRRS
jgi:hypothetical protein